MSVRLVWSDGVEEWVDGWACAWTLKSVGGKPLAVLVQGFPGRQGKGQMYGWLSVEDVTRR